MEGQALAVIPETQGLLPTLTPREQIEKASEMAKVLQDVVKQANLARNFGGKKDHLEYEAWQTIGQFFNCTPQTEWTKPIKDGDKIMGYEARVNVVNAEGRTIASAESMCLRDEPNWKNKPLYSLRSMAQTRTAGKALRSVFAWVAVLAGYSGTPAEEMSEDFNKPQERPKQDPQSSNPKPMSDPQRKKLWAMMKSEKELTDAEAKKFFEWYIEKGETVEVKGKPTLTSQSASAFIKDFDKLFDEFTQQPIEPIEGENEPWE